MQDFAALLKAQATEGARRLGARIPDRAIDQSSMRALHEDEHGAYAELRDSQLMARGIESEVQP